MGLAHVSVLNTVLFPVSVFLLGSGPGVWVPRAWALLGSQLGDLQHRPHPVTAAAAPPVLLPPLSAEVGEQGACVGPGGPRRGPLSLLCLGPGLPGQARWDSRVLCFLVGQQRWDCVFYYILIISDLEIIPMMLRTVFIIYFIFKKSFILE